MAGSGGRSGARRFNRLGAGVYVAGLREKVGVMGEVGGPKVKAKRKTKGKSRSSGEHRRSCL
jgi:hypothetical protein